MKSSLTDILDNVLAGKIIAKQKGVDERYWGRTILRAAPSNGYSYNILTDQPSYPWFKIEGTFELEVE